jgi:hypothetical protein
VALLATTQDERDEKSTTPVVLFLCLQHHDTYEKPAHKPNAVHLSHRGSMGHPHRGQTCIQVGCQAASLWLLIFFPHRATKVNCIMPTSQLYMLRYINTLPVGR